jgi:uncharacterized protein YcbK (DUF882 family)
MRRFFGIGWFVVASALAVALPARAAAQRVHEVQPGQTLSAIARRYQASVWDLALANEMRPESRLRVGQTLTVPPRGMTYVRPGQTLSHIAKQHGCTVAALQRLNGLRETTHVRAGSRLTLPGFAPAGVTSAAAIDRDWGEPERPGFVKLEGRTGRAEVEMVDQDGKIRLKGLRALAALMRRDESEPVQSVHPRLAVLLARISDHFGGRELRVISGFREAGGRTRPTSRHTQGRAADIQVSGVPQRAIWEYCRSLAQTGCGLYPNSVFVHVDVREESGQWVDWSRRGRRPRYGSLTRPYRRREAQQAGRARIGRKVTRPDEVPLFMEVVNRQNTVVRVVDERAIETPPSEQPPLEDAAQHASTPGTSTPL